MNFQLQLQPDAVPSIIPEPKSKTSSWKKEATEKIYCLGKINPNHISIFDFSEYVNDQLLMLVKSPPPLSAREKQISKDEEVHCHASRFNASCLFWCLSFSWLWYTKQPNTLMSSHVYSWKPYKCCWYVKHHQNHSLTTFMLYWIKV